MIQSLRSRLVLTHLLVGGLVLVMLAVSFLAIQVSNPAVERFVFERLDLISRVATGQPRLRPAIFVDVPLERTLSVLGRSIDATGVLLASDGGILATGPGEPPLLPAAAVRTIVATDSAARGSFRSAGGSRWLYLSRPLEADRYLVLLAPRPTFRTILVQVRELIAPIWQAALLALLASLGLALLFARWVSRPLSSLTEAAGEVATGNLERSVSPDGPLEIQQLARAFNAMVSRVRSSQQSQRDFIANVSHELKTPLTSIAGFAQAIVDGTAADPEEQRRAAQIIQEESQRLGRMVDELLALARFDAGQVELELRRVELDELLRECLVRMQPAAQAADVELRLEIGDIPEVVADSDRLAQVIVNLLDNAIKYSGQGGWVQLAAQRQGQWVSASVSDNGVGLTAEQLDRIFDRFYQVDSARAGGPGGGAGLGLAISQEIIQAHGGHLTAESEPGKGSCFTFKIPIAPSDISTLSRRG